MIALTKQALKRPSVTLIIAIAIVVFGLISLGSVKQELFPSLSFPIVSVTSVYPGASAEIVDQDVTAPIESAISGIQGIQSSQSTSAEGFAFIIIQFDVNADLKEAKANVEDKISALRLPTGVQAPKVGTFDFTSLPAINASVSGKSSSVSLSDVQARMQSEVIPALAAIKGVSNVSLTGGETTQVLVTLNPQKLADSNLTQQQVVQLLQANNLTFPVGTLDDAGRSLPLRVTHQYSTTVEIANLIVGVKAPGTPGAGPVRLGDVATVNLSQTGSATITRTNGQANLGLQVFTDQNANIVDVTNAVKAEMQRVENAQSTTPLTFKIVSEQAATIQNSIGGVVQEGLLGALVAVVVVFIFLLSIRTTLIAAVSIPVSVIVALILMQLQGFSLNILTLGGLAVAIGRVVDDSIVVLENIYRHVRKGDDLNSSVIDGTREVAGAITTSTLTTVAVFLPLGLAGGLVSKLFLPFSLTVTYALLSSLLVAITVVPLLARLFMGRVQVGKHEDDNWLQRVYTPVLKWSLNGQSVGNVTLAGQDGTGTNIDSGKPLELFVRVDPSALTLQNLRNLKVGTINPVALSEIATIDEVPGALSVTRINSNQAVSITGQITTQDTINVQRKVEAEIKKLSFPAGVEVGGGAQAASQAEALGGLGTALLVAIGLVYIVMLFWSGSLLTPFVILFSLPLAAIGAILGLFITGRPLGITSLIGMLMLIGIVVTNAIVLLDLVEQNRGRGMSTYDALVQGGRTRLRPILMTAIATILALSPLAFSVGGDSFLTGDLAIVVMGGLFTSTFLTLLVVPVVYSLVSGLQSRFTRTPKESAPPTEAEGSLVTVPTEG